MQEQETKETDHQPSGGHTVNSSPQSSNYAISNSIGNYPQLVNYPPNELILSYLTLSNLSFY